MFIKVASIGLGETKKPIIIAVDTIQDVQVGYGCHAEGGKEIGRIWLKGNLTSTPNHMTVETTAEIWEMLKPYVAKALMVHVSLPPGDPLKF